jgi:hypothetical protein
LRRWPFLRRQPTNNTDLTPGFATLAPVRVEIFRRAAGTWADLVELLARHSGSAENIAIEPAQIDE